MSIIGPAEKQRVAYSGLDPATLRIRMIDPDAEEEETDEETDAAILKALEKMSDGDRWATLQILPDEMILRFHARGWIGTD